MIDVYEVGNTFVSLKGVFDNYSKFLVHKLFKSILRYKFTLKGKKKLKETLSIVSEEDVSENIDDLDDTEYLG